MGINETKCAGTMVIEWRKISIIENYEVSNYGDVRRLGMTITYKDGRSFYRGMKLLKSSLHSMGYFRVNLGRKQYFIHRLVAIAFLENPNNYEQVNHKNGIRTDNKIDNLEWISNTENQRHSWRELNRKPSPGCSRKVINSKTGITYNSIKEASASCNLPAWKLRLSLLGINNVKTDFVYA